MLHIQTQVATIDSVTSVTTQNMFEENIDIADDTKRAGLTL